MLNIENSKKGTVWTVPAGKLVAAQTKLWNCLGEQGADIVIQIDDDENFRQKVAEFMLRRGIEPSIDQRVVRAIMGVNYFDPSDWAKFYNVVCTKKQLKELARFPWGEDVLMSKCPLCGQVVRECHLAHVGVNTVQGNPLTFVRFREFYPPTNQSKFASYEDAWYNNEDFASVTTLDLRWYLTHLEIVPKSESKTTADQQAMLSADYELPLAIEETVKSFHYVRKTGKYLNPKRYARCRDLSTTGGRVDVGPFVSNGFRINCYADDAGLGALGAGASR